MNGDRPTIERFRAHLRRELAHVDDDRLLDLTPAALLGRAMAHAPPARLDFEDARILAIQAVDEQRAWRDLDPRE